MAQKPKTILFLGRREHMTVVYFIHSKKNIIPSLQESMHLNLDQII